MKRLHAIISGRVQGVFYRNFVRTQADRLQVTGWVRNLPDDTVEVMAEGEDSALEALVSRLEIGSPESYVEEVRITYATASGEFFQFQVR